MTIFSRASEFAAELGKLAQSGSRNINRMLSSPAVWADFDRIAAKVSQKGLQTLESAEQLNLARIYKTFGTALARDGITDPSVQRTAFLRYVRPSFPNEESFREFGRNWAQGLKRLEAGERPPAAAKPIAPSHPALRPQPAKAAPAPREAGASAPRTPDTGSVAAPLGPNSDFNIGRGRRAADSMTGNAGEPPARLAHPTMSDGIDDVPGGGKKSDGSSGSGWNSEGAKIQEINRDTRARIREFAANITMALNPSKDSFLSEADIKTIQRSLGDQVQGESHPDLGPDELVQWLSETEADPKGIIRLKNKISIEDFNRLVRIPNALKRPLERNLSETFERTGSVRGPAALSRTGIDSGLSEIDQMRRDLREIGKLRESNDRTMITLANGKKRPIEIQEVESYLRHPDHQITTADFDELINIPQQLKQKRPGITDRVQKAALLDDQGTVLEKADVDELRKTIIDSNQFDELNPNTRTHVEVRPVGAKGKGIAGVKFQIVEVEPPKGAPITLDQLDLYLRHPENKISSADFQDLIVHQQRAKTVEVRKDIVVIDNAASKMGSAYNNRGKLPGVNFFDDLRKSLDVVGTAANGKRVLVDTLAETGRSSAFQSPKEVFEALGRREQITKSELTKLESFFDRYCGYGRAEAADDSAPSTGRRLLDGVTGSLGSIKPDPRNRTTAAMRHEWETGELPGLRTRIGSWAQLHPRSAAVGTAAAAAMTITGSLTGWASLRPDTMPNLVAQGYNMVDGPSDAGIPAEEKNITEKTFSAAHNRPGFFNARVLEYTGIDLSKGANDERGNPIFIENDTRLLEVASALTNPAILNDPNKKGQLIRGLVYELQDRAGLGTTKLETSDAVIEGLRGKLSGNIANLMDRPTKEALALKTRILGKFGIVLDGEGKFDQLDAIKRLQAGTNQDPIVLAAATTYMARVAKMADPDKQGLDAIATKLRGNIDALSPLQDAPDNAGNVSFAGEAIAAPVAAPELTPQFKTAAEFESYINDNAALLGVDAIKSNLITSWNKVAADGKTESADKPALEAEFKKIKGLDPSVVSIIAASGVPAPANM